MENQHPEALILVNDRPSAIGDGLYQWALDAEDMIRRLHARVADLEDHITTLTTWKKEDSLEVRGGEVMVEQERRIVELEAEAIKESHRLAEANLRAAQMESQHKQAADIATAATKELATKSERIQELEALLESVGAGGVSAQRITQAKDHIAQVREMEAAPVVLPEHKKSATFGMSLQQRILHVGGRENAKTYIEFGSIGAVGRLVSQVLRDLPGGSPGFEAQFGVAVEAAIAASKESK